MTLGSAVVSRGVVDRTVAYTRLRSEDNRPVPGSTRGHLLSGVRDHRSLICSQPFNALEPSGTTFAGTCCQNGWHASFCAGLAHHWQRRHGMTYKLSHKQSEQWNE